MSTVIYLVLGLVVFGYLGYKIGVVKGRNTIFMDLDKIEETDDFKEFSKRFNDNFNIEDHMGMDMGMDIESGEGIPSFPGQEEYVNDKDDKHLRDLPLDKGPSEVNINEENSVKQVDKVEELKQGLEVGIAEFQIKDILKRLDGIIVNIDEEQPTRIKLSKAGNLLSLKLSPGKRQSNRWMSYKPSKGYMSYITLEEHLRRIENDTYSK